MKVQTKDLIGPTLDWAVAKCEGVPSETFLLFYDPVETDDLDTHGYPEFHYSTVWAQGGLLIEREEVMLLPPLDDDGWTARCGGDAYPGDTPLIAAMRAFVASKLGEEVDVPEELCGDIK